MTHWLDQEGITILRHGNMLVGFQRKERADTDALLTFFFPRKEDVDEVYSEMKDVALGEPQERPRFRIYNFFALDPEGRKIEFQAFLHDLPPGPHSWGNG